MFKATIAQNDKTYQKVEEEEEDCTVLDNKMTNYDYYYYDYDYLTKANKRWTRGGWHSAW